MVLDLSFRAGFWLPAAGSVFFAWFNPAAALESAAPSNPDDLPVSIETETAAAVLGTRTLPDGTRLKEWLPATDIQQGQVVYYTVKIRNLGTTAAHNVVVTRAVPANTRYLADSAAAPGAAVSFSVNGGATFAPARELLVRDSRGAERAAAPETYTHIQVSPQTIRAQETLAGLQGAGGIYFAGGWTLPFDSQETALLSAINVAERLAPRSSKLARLREAT